MTAACSRPSNQPRSDAGISSRRFAPATCLAMPARSRVPWLKRGPQNPHGVVVLRDDGMHTRFEGTDSGIFQHRGVLKT